MGETHFSGPILGSSDSMKGLLEDAPLGVFADTRWTRYFQDFQEVSQGFDTNDWTESEVGTAGSTATILQGATASEGILRITPPAAADSGATWQMDGGAAQGSSQIGVTPTAATAGSAAATDTIFISRFRIADVSASAVFVGLAELNATSVVLTADAAVGNTSDNCIGFENREGTSGAIYFTTAGTAAANEVTIPTTPASTSTDVIPSALADSEYVEVAVRATGTTGYSAYVKIGGAAAKWKHVTSGTGTAWNAQMVPTFANVGAAAADVLDIDYFIFLQRRDLIE